MPTLQGWRHTELWSGGISGSGQEGICLAVYSLSNSEAVQSEGLKE